MPIDSLEAILPGEGGHGIHFFHISTIIEFAADATRHDHVDVRIVGHRRTRGMQHRGDADSCAEMLGICGDDRHRLGSRVEQQAISADRTR